MATFPWLLLWNIVGTACNGDSHLIGPLHGLGFESDAPKSVQIPLNVVGCSVRDTALQQSNILRSLFRGELQTWDLTYLCAATSDSKGLQDKEFRRVTQTIFKSSPLAFSR